jgi:Rha family phage regulatory protein
MKNELMIFERKEQAVVSSRTVAEKFEKDHKNVLQTIENLMPQIRSAEKSAHLFYASTYEDSYKRQQKEYLMNRDGFSLLAMGFTGSAALQWKLKYIKVFNDMESFIKERQSSEWLMTRKQGKLIRRSETDTIANLVEYAEVQGSRNMRKQAYNIYSKLVNSLVGIEAGQRETVSFKVISTIGFLEDMILHTIDEEMQKGTHYKEIYKICKANGEQIIRFAYLPKLAA